jgi:hypothetical protein
MDFPDKWPELVEHILTSIDTVCENISSISSENIEDLYRLLKLYIEVLKEQSMKRLGLKRAAFVKQSKVHLEKLFNLWQNIDIKSWNDSNSSVFGDSKTIYVISKLLDKCIVHIMI